MNNNRAVTRKVYLSATSDCILAKYELEHINTYFTINGWKVVDSKADADIIILNTCGLIPYKEEESLAAVDEQMKSLNKGQEMLLTGCLVKMNSSELDEKFQGFKFGRTETTLLDEYIGAKYSLETVKNYNLYSETHPETSFIRISQGCMGQCTYCAIRGAKGRLKSVPQEIIIKDMQDCVAHGSYYFVLLADDVGCYGQDLGNDFANLLEGILEIDSNFNLFIYNMEPSYLVKLQERLVPQLLDRRIGTLKVPIQSGSQKILKLMNRHYEVDDVLRLIDEIKSGNPEIKLISHLIVGFPQENVEDLEKSLEVARHFDEMVILTYGPRNGLPSTKLPGQISEEVKLERLKWMKKQLEGHNKACFMYSKNGAMI